MLSSVSKIVSSAKKKATSALNDSVFEKYASKADLAQYKALISKYGSAILGKLNKLLNIKNYAKAKAGVQEDAAKAAAQERAKAKPLNDYEEWKAKQPSKNVSKDWLNSVNNFINNNKTSIVGISDLVSNTSDGTSSSSSGSSSNIGKTASVNTSTITPALKNALNDIKDKVKNKAPLTPEEKKEIFEKNPRSVSMRMYTFIRDSEVFTPFVKQQEFAVKIGFGHIVDTNSPYYAMYPSRSEDYLAEEYMIHAEANTLNDWLKTVTPSLIPKEMVYELFNKDINAIETIINKELTDVKLSQNEFDALASFLWTMREEGIMYDEFLPTRVIKELHTLLYYEEDRKVATQYMWEVDKRLVLTSKRWNRRQAEITLFLGGKYECLSAAIIDKRDYENMFSTMKNEYIAQKNGDKHLKAFNKFLGNENLESSIVQSYEDNINLYIPFSNGVDSSGQSSGGSGGETSAGSGSSGGAGVGSEEKTKTKTILKSFSSNDIIGEKLENNMIYPVLGKNNPYRGGKDNTGINNDDTICFGWFGSDRGEGQGIHYGVDLLCEKNNPIIMPYSGTIITVGLASEVVTSLKRVVILPDDNKDVVIGIYYLKNLKVEQGQHYDAGTLLGYVGDCSELFTHVNTKEFFDPYDYIHVQFNRYEEKGLPLNPTAAILNARNAEEPQVLENLKLNPVIEEAFSSGSQEKTVNIEYPGIYQITLVGAGGTSMMFPTTPIIDLPVTVDKVNPKYSVLCTNSAYIIANKFLEEKAYDYSYTSAVSSATTFEGTIFNNELKAENGKRGFTTDNENGYIAPSEYVIPDSYTYIGGSNGNSSLAVSNIGGYDIQTGNCVPFLIKSGLAGAYKTYGKGGTMLLNDYEPTSETEPTLGYIKIQYLDWK